VVPGRIVLDLDAMPPPGASQRENTRRQLFQTMRLVFQREQHSERAVESAMRKVIDGHQRRTDEKVKRHLDKHRPSALKKRRTNQRPIDASLISAWKSRRAMYPSKSKNFIINKVWEDERDARPKTFTPNTVKSAAKRLKLK
jgi:hypothetical protein